MKALQEKVIELLELMAENGVTVIHIGFKQEDRISSVIAYMGEGKEADEIVLDMRELERKIHQKKSEGEKKRIALDLINPETLN